MFLSSHIFFLRSLRKYSLRKVECLVEDVSRGRIFQKNASYLWKVGSCLNFQGDAQMLWSHGTILIEVLHGRMQTDLKTLHFGHNGEQMY